MTTVAVPTLSITIGGTIATSSTWDTTLWFHVTAPVTDAQTLCQDTVTGSIEPIRTFLRSGWAPFNTADTGALSLVTRYYPANASAASARAQGDFGDFEIGSNANGAAASQCVVTSLLTAVATRSGRGRLYWPATGGFGGSVHRYDDTLCQNMANDLAALYESIVLAAPSDAGLVGVVRSGKLHSVNNITTIRVDTRPDRQEHRESRLTFNQHSAPVTTA